MASSVRAVFEKGVLRPLEPVNLPENTEVTLTIANGDSVAEQNDWLDADFHASCASEADSTVSLEHVRAALAKIPGSLTEAFIAERDER